MDNYFNILQIKKDSSKEEIKKAYRQLTLKHHPDKGGNKEIFNKINEAFENLYNNYDDIKKTYNKTFNNKQNHNDKEYNNKQLNIEKNSFIEPIIKNIEITLEESYTGIQYPLLISRNIIIDNIKQNEVEKIYIFIPEGIDDNEIIRVKEKGNIINEKKGDIKIYIKIKDNNLFKRNGLNLIYKKNISLKEALCGLEFNLNHINGNNYLIKNSSIVQPNSKKILKSKGMKREDMYGDLIIEFNIVFPSYLNNDSKNILREIL